MSKKTTTPNLNSLLIVAVVLLLSFVTLYHFMFARRIIPGVEISGINVGGMSLSQAQRVLTDRATSSDSKFTFSYGDTNFEFDTADLNVAYNVNATVVRAFEAGRTGNVLVDTKDKIAGILKPLRIKSFYNYDDLALNSTLSYIESAVNTDPQNAYYYIENDQVKVKPSEIGRKVDDTHLYNAIVKGLDYASFEPQSLSVEDVAPEISDEILQKHLVQLSEIIFVPKTITYKDFTWELTPEDLLSFIDISFENGESQLSLNDPVLEAYVENLASAVNVLPRGHVTESEDKSLAFEIIQDGYDLDKKQFGIDFKDAVFDKKSNVELTMITISGSKDPKEYGIVGLLGEGVSEYTGSASTRIHNLNLAAERTDGVLVPPGEIYSFNNSIGGISAATGYQTAYVISNGRTVLGDGGGVCQTSTTLFRAVLNSGLPVIKRNPHAYRVRYYELDSPLGLDAAIYQPSLDFQFKNDTTAYVLIQVEPDIENSKLKFKLYGTPDGRKVELSESVITGETPPPEPLYQDDPNLQEGIVKQIDFAAWGATASFKRTVKKDDQVIFEDTFTTRYQPWRAIYLVGKKTD